MNRATNLRGRAPLSKVYVPYTEGYLRRVELCRNAILANVIQRANLGPDPITTIKIALASCFGGYTEDFAVAHCREKDFAIFLPEWVSIEVLTRREVLTLNGFWIPCWLWGRYRDARPHCVQCKVWIRLINLPFEIWSVARVAALISGFGRFIKADDVTKAMTDFRAFRCHIALDSLSSIPQNLSVIVGEELSWPWSTWRGGKGQWTVNSWRHPHHHVTKTATPRSERVIGTIDSMTTEVKPKRTTT